MAEDIMNILIVEDEKFIAELLALFMEKFYAKKEMKVNIAQANNLEKAIRNLEEKTYQLITCDYNLPAYNNVKNGLELIRGIREGNYGEANKKASIILITSEPIGDDEINSFKISYLQKPFGYDIFKKNLEQLKI